MLFIEACTADDQSSGADWTRVAYEIKHDDFRFIVRREPDCVRVFSRRGQHTPTERMSSARHASGRITDARGGTSNRSARCRLVHFSERFDLPRRDGNG